MRKGLLAAAAALLAGHSLALAQSWGPYQPMQPWGPMGPPPSPPRMVSTWTPPAPVVRPPMYPAYPTYPTYPANAYYTGYSPYTGLPVPARAVIVPAQQLALPNASSNPLPAAELETAPAEKLPTAVQPALPGPATADTAPRAPSSDASAPAAECATACPSPSAEPVHLCHPAAKSAGVWFSGEYLLWWFKNGRVPPLVAGGGNGFMGVPGGSQVLLDNLDFDNDPHQGARFTVGYQCKSLPVGFEGSYFFLAPRQEETGYSSSGSPIIGQPIINAVTGEYLLFPVAFPGVLTGDMQVRARNWLWGFDANGTLGLLGSNQFHAALLGGFRFLRLQDEVATQNHISVLAGNGVDSGLVTSSSAFFHTTNDFYGGQIGADVGCSFGKLTLDVRTKLALGNLHQRATISGATFVDRPFVGQFVVPTSGLLALPTNIGSYSENQIAFIPEVNVNLGLQVTSHLKVFGGYSFLWINSVWRAGDQIDMVVNRTQTGLVNPPPPVVGPARPAFPGRDADFWAQGLNFGLELSF